MKSGDDLPHSANIVHYVARSEYEIRGDHIVVTWKAFRKNLKNDDVSVHWLQALSDEPVTQLNEVRRVSRLQLRESGRFAEVNVGEIQIEMDTIGVVYDPMPEMGEFPADPSHSNIVRLPNRDDKAEEDVCTRIAMLVNGCHLAKLE